MIGKSLEIAGVSENVLNYIENKTAIFSNIISFLGTDFISGFN